MNRKVIGLSLIFSTALLIAGYFLSSSYEFGLCYSNLETLTFDVSCHAAYEKIGATLFYGMSALAIVFFILLFTPSAFPAWKKFAKWFIPIATLIFIFYSGPGSGDYFSPYPEQVYKWISILYVIVSVILITVSALKSRRVSKTM